MDKAQRISRLKNLAIALLLVSALYLLYRAVFYEDSFLAGGIFGCAGTSQTQNSPSGMAALSEKPAYLLVTGLDHTHTAAKYNSDTRDKLLSQFSASLGEALGSAGDPKAVSTEEWQGALSGSGVFYDYLWPQPLSVVAGSLGTSANGAAASVSARRLFLSVSDGVHLYYINAADGNAYRCTTALSAASLSAKLSDYHSGEAKFAFEQGDAYQSLDPYFIFSGEDTSLDALTAGNPLPDSGEVTKLFTVFGMSSRTVSGNIEKGGSVVYVEGSRSLRVDTSGSVLFSVMDKSGVSIAYDGELTATEIISTCAGIAENTIGHTAGEAELVLKVYEADSDTGSINVEFGYMVDGIPITAADGSPAATFKVSNGMITRAELNFRKFAYTGDALTALPEAQSAAIALADGGEPVLTYNDRSDGVTASWIVR